MFLGPEVGYFCLKLKAKAMCFEIDIFLQQAQMQRVLTSLFRTGIHRRIFLGIISSPKTARK